MSSRPALWPYLLLLVPATLWLDFTRFHQYHHGDSLVPILTSLYEWTPFFWDSNRNGSLVPLLALPFRDPYANLLVQCGISIFSGFAAYFILGFYLAPRRVWPCVAAPAAAQFLLLFPPKNSFEMLCGCQPYFVSLVVGIAALVLVDRRPAKIGWARLAGSAVLMAIAHWQNLGLVVVLGPLIVFRAFGAATDDGMPLNAWQRLTKPETLRSLVVLAIGSACGFTAMQTLGFPDTGLYVQPPNEWFRCLSSLAEKVWEGASPAFWLVSLFGLAASVIAIAMPRTRQATRTAWRNSFIMLATAGTCFCCMAILKHVEWNLFALRYAMPAVVLTQLAAIAPAASALDHLAGQWLPRLALTLTLPILLLASVVSFGMPALDEPRTALDRSIGSYSSEIIDAKCTHVAGNYFLVWPAVYHANLVLAEQGERRVVWGISHRSGPTMKYWAGVPKEKLRVAAPISEIDTERFMAEAERNLEAWFPDFQFRRKEARRTILIYVPDRTEHQAMP